MIIKVENYNKSNRTKRKVYPLYNAKINYNSSNADYRDAKRTFCEADIFEFLNVDRLEVSFVNYTTGCT